MEEDINRLYLYIKNTGKLARNLINKSSQTFIGLIYSTSADIMIPIDIGILSQVMLDLGKARSNTVNYNNHHSSILVVDDEHDIVNLVKQSLELNGQKKVCGFIDPIKALDHLKSDSNGDHSIVISDIRMPGMNGYEFVMNAKKINPKVKVILMSAFEMQEREFHNLLPR